MTFVIGSQARRTGRFRLVSDGRARKHNPRLTLLPDGRYEVRCPECWASRDSPPPIGIGVPITSRLEAEAIFGTTRTWAA